MRIWTQEQRNRQAEAIRKWKPWERSTGPASYEGKAISSRNALKHGMRAAEWTEELRCFNDLLKNFKASAAFSTDENRPAVGCQIFNSASATDEHAEYFSEMP